MAFGSTPLVRADIGTLTALFHSPPTPRRVLSRRHATGGKFRSREDASRLRRASTQYGRQWRNSVMFRWSCSVVASRGQAGETVLFTARSRRSWRAVMRWKRKASQAQHRRRNKIDDSLNAWACSQGGLPTRANEIYMYCTGTIQMSSMHRQTSRGRARRWRTCFRWHRPRPGASARADSQARQQLTRTR